jgi:UDPglucose--hexose-1-phosphate uridylyltransferase
VGGAVKPLPKHEFAREDGRRVFAYGSVDTSRPDFSDAETGLLGIHKRLDLLTGDWVAISPARNIRPLDTDLPRDDEDGCPVCPGGVELPFSYEAAVFENRFPSFAAEPPLPPPGDLMAPSYGRCEVVIYTSQHDTCFGRLTPVELGRLLAIWSDRSRELWADERHEFVMIFENRGPEAGATLSHPHGQIYAIDHLPPIAAAKTAAHQRYRAKEGGCLGCQLVHRESASPRVIAPNESFVVGVPFAPRWPYEVTVRARHHGLSRLADLTTREQLDLATALRDVALRYDALFGVESPYLMVAQEAPRNQPDWHLAFDFLPFQRSRATMKIRASVETATGLFLNDVLPEDAARRLAKLEVPAEPIGDECLFAVKPAPAGRGSRRVGAPS